MNRFNIKNKDNIVDISTNDKGNATITIKENKKLGEVLNEMPCGIINKNTTGIGATTLELNSHRNSIIVLPTKVLAYNKHTIFEENFYVGSEIGKLPSIGTDHINQYLSWDINPRKFLVVADSLPKLISTLFSKKINVYRDYFFMVDEVDIIQSDVTYRPALENVIDYYFKFNPEKRCLVSATIRDFLHPELQKEPTVNIKYESNEARTINAYYTKNIHVSIKKYIENIVKNSNSKILIAYNSVMYIKTVIDMLDDETKQKCGILCSEASKNSAGDYYCILEEKNKLPKEINFITCAYYVGVDINDDCHILCVSNVNKPYTLLSTNKIIQIRGRCRKNILSEKFMFNLKEKDNLSVDYIVKEYVYAADKAVKLFNQINSYKDDEHIKNIFQDIKHAISEKTVGRVHGEKDIPLTRITIDKEYAISYFNIDSISERLSLKHNLYSDINSLVKEFENNGFEVFLEKDNSNMTSDEYRLIHKTDNNKKELDRAILNEAMEYILPPKPKKKSKPLLFSLPHKHRWMHASMNLKVARMKPKDRIIKTYYDRVYLYHMNYDIYYIAPFFIEYHFMNKKRKKALSYSLFFNALDETHPLKLYIKKVFPIDSVKTSEEIEKSMKTIYKTLRINTANKTQKILIEEFRYFVHAERMSNRKKGYKIIDYNPNNIDEPIYYSVAADTIDLNEYFNIYL